MARSISLASRTLIGLTPPRVTAPRLGWRRIARCRTACVGSRRTATRVTPGAISLSSSSHFPLMPYSKMRKAGGIAAWPRQAVDKAAADRIGDIHEHDRHGAGRLAAMPRTAAPPAARMTSGASATNSAAYLRMSLGIGRAPAGVDPHIAADGPAQLLQPSQNAAIRACLPDRSRPVVMSTPIRRMRSDCCARATSGHAAAAPPEQRENLAAS